MSRVLKTLAQSVVLLATVMSPVAVSAIQIANDFESIPDALEYELVPQDSEQTAADSQDPSIQSTAPKVPVSQAESVAAAAAAAAEKSSGNPASPVGISEMHISPAGMSFSSPGNWGKNSQVSFMCNSATVSLGSDSSSCYDFTGGEDILSLMVFAQPGQFASLAEFGSLSQFTDPSAWFFSPSLAPLGGQSERGHATGGTRAQGVSTGARGPATNLSSASASSGVCGCVGGDCGGEPESGGGLLSAFVRMIKQFANCLIFSE